MKKFLITQALFVAIIFLFVNISVAGPCDPVAGQIEVRASGQQYCTSIQEAINAAPGTAANPTVIKVMPGTYEENITMKSYVHLQGAGRDVTTIDPLTIDDTIWLNGLEQVAISGFTIIGSPGCSGNCGTSIIRNTGSSLSLTENTFMIDSNGIVNENSLSPTIIEKNIFIGLSGGSACEHGIYNMSSSPLISGNYFDQIGCVGITNDSSSPTISGNTILNHGYGIRNDNGSSPTISGNTITADSVHRYKGIAGTDSATIINNRITGHPYDIDINAGSTSNISFNVLDTFSGSGGKGNYNVDSNGDPIAIP